VLLTAGLGFSVQLKKSAVRFEKSHCFAAACAILFTPFVFYIVAACAGVGRGFASLPKMSDYIMITITNMEALSQTDQAIHYASQALRTYIRQGPDMPHESMRIVTMERVRSQLGASPLAQHREVQGWVAIEQAFVLGHHPDMHDKYPMEPLFQEADEAFAAALDNHQEDDTVEHLCRVELGLAALPLYYAWATGQPLDKNHLMLFDEDVAETGRKLLEMRDVYTDEEDRKTLHGMVAEVVTLLTYNRRYCNERSPRSLALPSTMRQNLARHAGMIHGNDAQHKRHNWDVTVAAPQAGRWSLTDKLQVKTALGLDTASPHNGDNDITILAQDYGDDITVVSVREHICKSLPFADSWSALNALILSREPHTAHHIKRDVRTMGRNLHDHLERRRRRYASEHTY